MFFKLLRESGGNFSVYRRRMSVVCIDVWNRAKVSCFGKFFEKIYCTKEIGTAAQNALTKCGRYVIITKIIDYGGPRHYEQRRLYGQYSTMHNSIWSRRLPHFQGTTALIPRVQVCLFAFPQISDLIFLPVNAAETTNPTD